jgi:hypothetical protein
MPEKRTKLEETNYLANLKRHQLLGKIKSADYFAHQNHRGLKTVWAPDSSWCVVEYDGRFGFDTISILEPKDSNFVQTDIGKRVDEVLASAIRKRSHGRDNSDDTGGGDATSYFRIDANGKLRVRAVSTTDPKQLDPKNCRSAFFYGTFDVASKKWLNAEARALTSEEYEGAGSAFGDIDSEVGATTFVREEDKLQALDEMMNGVYGVVRAILPATRFAAVKKEQIEWLKRDAAVSTEEKCKLIQARIKALQQFVW